MMESMYIANQTSYGPCRTIREEEDGGYIFIFSEGNEQCMRKTVSDIWRKFSPYALFPSWVSYYQAAGDFRPKTVFPTPFNR